MDLPSFFNVRATVALLAVAASTLLIFIPGSFLRRGKMTTPSDDTGEDVPRSRQDLGDEEDQGDEEGQEDIFLSHSGWQKNFTEHLYDALKRANHTVFLDKHTLPIASPFPANIKKALRGCKLGVLVLSEDFLTSKWPMVELGILVKNGIEVLPLFFMLNTEDLKSPKNLSRWRKKWKTMAKNRQQAEQWENAVKKLHTINGIVYKHQEGEVAYINKVVTKICNFIRPCPIYDQSNIQGSRALAEVVGLMKQHVKELDVFLGIDNIWEHSINDADRLLKVGFSANSKVLLTSRSKGVLQTLLSGCAVTGDYYHHLVPLPAPDDEDAFQIFQQSVKHDGFFPSLLRNQIKDVLHRCRCDGKYHPLALKALGAYASRLCGLGNFKSRPDWTGVLGKLQNADLHGVDAVIRLNYESLDEVQQHIFLDIALCLTTFRGTFFRRSERVDICRFLCALYRELCEIDIRAHIHDLAMAGVVDIGNMEDLEVHDMYVDLARKEAARSPRYLTSMKEAVEGKERGNLKRVILLEPKEKVELRQCEEVEFLHVSGVKAEDEIYPEWMPSLRILVLGLSAFGRQVWNAQDREFRDAQMAIWRHAQKRKLNLKELVHLEYLVLDRCFSDVEFGGRNALQNLRLLSISGCAGLEDVDSIRYATQLESLFIMSCPALKRLPDLGVLSGLELLRLEGNSSLEELGCLSPSLKKITVEGCEALKRMPDLGGLTGLVSLCLFYNDSLEELGCLSPALEVMVVTGCPALKTIGNVGGLTRLERLVLNFNESLEEVGNLSSPINGRLEVTDCKNLARLQIRNCKKLATLDMLKVRGRAFTKERWVGGYEAGQIFLQVQDLRFEEFSSVRIIELGRYKSLERLEVAKCEALEQILGLHRLRHLKELVLRDCAPLKDTNGQFKALCQSQYRPTLMRISGCPGLNIASET